ncbi:MAG: hypothetical protein ACT4PE_12230 [Candidatus Eiseniibacteriota bacterium]
MPKQLRNLIAVFALLASAGVAAAGPGQGSGRPGGDGDPDGPMVIQPITAVNQPTADRKSAALTDGAEVRAKQGWWMKSLRAYLKLSRWFSI